MIRILLIGLLFFIAVTATPSGALLVLKPDGSTFQMSVLLLKDTPFPNFIIPGLVLCILVGGSALVALVAIFLKYKKARLFALLAGIMQSGWIIVQMLLIKVLAGLQFTYLGVGVAVFLLALLWKPKTK